jgi:hypothetical protein
MAAMRSAKTVTVAGKTNRGTTVIHTFSLDGFAAAVDDAAARCR